MGEHVVSAMMSALDRDGQHGAVATRTTESNLASPAKLSTGRAIKRTGYSTVLTVETTAGTDCCSRGDARASTRNLEDWYRQVQDEEDFLLRWLV